MNEHNFVCILYFGYARLTVCDSSRITGLVSTELEFDSSDKHFLDSEKVRLRIYLRSWNLLRGRDWDRCGLWLKPFLSCWGDRISGEHVPGPCCT